MNTTIERIIPDFVESNDITGKESLILHIERYEFASKYVKPGRLLDIACGVGYGTSLLLQKRNDITEAVGVDISVEAIEYAKRNYQDKRIFFQVKDALTFEDKKGFDSIVCIETLEHIYNPDGLIERLLQMLLPNGVFIASVPITPSVDVNPYHVNDFTEKSFKEMMKKYDLSEINCLKQIQKYKLIKTILRKESRMTDLRRNLFYYYLKNPTAIFKRIYSTLMYGFTNQYITIVWEKKY